MKKIRALVFAIFLQWAVFLLVRGQFQDPLHSHLNNKDDNHHGLTEKEFNEILSQYDNNDDGELSSEELSKYFKDAMASLQGETTKDQQQGRKGEDSRLKRHSTQAQQSNWSAKQIGAVILVVLCLVLVLTAVVQKRKNIAVDVEDIRAARLRRLATQQLSPTGDDTTQTSRARQSQSNRDSVVLRDVPFSRRKVKSENQSLNEKNKEQRLSVQSKIEKSRLETSRHNMPSEERTCQPEVASVRAAGATFKQPPVECKDLSPKTSPVVADVDADNLFGEANIERSNIGCEMAEVFKEPPKKNSGPKQEQLMDISYEDIVQKVLVRVFECSMEIQCKRDEMLSLVKVEKLKGNVVLQVDASELPTNSDDLSKKLEKLLAKRMFKELDPMKFSIQCFDQCSQLPGKQFKSIRDGVNIWKEVTSAIKEHCVHSVLKHLVHAAASPTSTEDDLWSDFVTSEQSEAPSQFFLTSLGGWSPDGVIVNTDLLFKLLEKGKEDPEIKDTFVEMIIVAGRQVAKVKRLNEITPECKSFFRGLETLLSQPVMTEFLAEALEKELESGIKELGVFFQEKSLFSFFLRVSTIDVKVDKKSRASACFLELPHFPRAFQSDIDSLQYQIMDGIHSCQNIVYKAMVKILKSSRKDSALAWLAGVVSLLDLRLSASLPSDNFQAAVTSDGFMLNLCSVLLQLCDSFMLSKGKGKYKQIQPLYCTSKGCRLKFDNERTLAGGHIGAEKEGKTDMYTDLFPTKEEKDQFKLMTEMFHITHGALHIGLNNTIQHYNRLLRNYMLMNEMKEGTPVEMEAKKLLMLFVYQWETCMLDPVLIRLCSEFYLTNAAWLAHLLDSCVSEYPDLSPTEIQAKQKELFLSLPEFYVKDMCSWFSYIALHKPGALKGLDICAFVDCCCKLIDRRDLMPGPVAAARIVNSLLSFAEICKRRKRQSQLLDTTTWGSGIEGDLEACVAMCPAVKDKLCPALVHTYCSVDIVEGLDVDREEFDKFTARFEIVKLLEVLWKKSDFRKSILAECGKESFQSFLGAVLDTLLYVLKDGLLRLTNVRKLQCAKQCDEKWKELSPGQRQEKEQFLKGEEHVSKSFMEMANATLEFLEKITEEDKVARCFSRSPLSQKAAAAIIGFLASLCGRKSLDLKVQNMEKYSFNPRELLVKILTVLVRLSNASEEREFVKCLAADPDYCRFSLQKALCVVQRENLAPDDVIQDLKRVTHEVESLLAREEDHPCPNTTELDQDVNQPVSVEDRPARGGEGACVSESRDVEVAAEAYIEALEPIKFDTAELVNVHAFRCCASQTICSRSGKVRALMREAAQLKNYLPIHPNASIFVRQDENRMDFARALITGTVDTPYSRGCFVFDIYFPSSYPVDPPLVKIITTGNGTVRFNPNLYADGKVCLSLLGTWHGGDASEKWDSKKSSLYQVLLSIQAMMFTSDPCFNEPGYEGIKGTDEGDILCREENARIRLATVRHAMVGQLREPTPGLEDVIREHFRHQKEAVLKQCAAWLLECADADEERRMRKAVDSLRIELDKL